MYGNDLHALTYSLVRTPVNDSHINKPVTRRLHATCQSRISKKLFTRLLASSRVTE